MEKCLSIFIARDRYNIYGYVTWFNSRIILVFSPYFYFVSWHFYHKFLWLIFYLLIFVLKSWVDIIWIRWEFVNASCCFEFRACKIHVKKKKIHQNEKWYHILRILSSWSDWCFSCAVWFFYVYGYKLPMVQVTCAKEKSSNKTD